MSIHSHEFVESFDGLIGFGFDRQTNENTLVYYLQKIADDKCARHLIEQMSDQEHQELFAMLTGLLKRHLSEAEYHRLFLKN